MLHSSPASGGAGPRSDAAAGGGTHALRGERCLGRDAAGRGTRASALSSEGERAEVEMLALPPPQVGPGVFAGIRIIVGEIYRFSLKSPKIQQRISY